MDLTQRLAGRTAIVTGSGGSIGRATCLRFAAEGANVVGCDVNPAGGEETVRLVGEAGGTMISVHPADLTDKSVCERVVAAAVERFGGVDILFNNGAMAYFAWIEAMDDETWYKTINQELDLVFLMTRAVWPELVKSNGNIVNVASLSAWAGIERLPGLAHAAAKGGVLAMTRELGVQFARQGIRVNALCPGPVNTPLLQELFAKDPERAQRRLVHVPMGRFAEPEELAASVAFLASDDASFITATAFVVDGGVTNAYVTPL